MVWNKQVAKRLHIVTFCFLRFFNFILEFHSLHTSLIGRYMRRSAVLKDSKMCDFLNVCFIDSGFEGKQPVQS